MTSPSAHPNQKQIARLYALAGQAGLGRGAVHDEIFARYGVESTKDLSLRQYEDFTAFLAGMVRGLQRKPPVEEKSKCEVRILGKGGEVTGSKGGFKDQNDASAWALNQIMDGGRAQIITVVDLAAVRTR